MFYFLRQDLFRELNSIEIVGHTSETADVPWIRGVRFDRPLTLQTLDLDPTYGSDFPDFFDTSIPVMSKAMLEALRSWGVSNIDDYPVLLRNRVSGEINADYAAINLVGAVNAADLSSSEYRLLFGSPEFTGRVSIDPARTGGLSAFRLVDGPGFIVVRGDLADLIRAKNFKAVLLQPTLDFRGT